VSGSVATTASSVGGLAATITLPPRVTILCVGESFLAESQLEHEKVLGAEALVCPSKWRRGKWRCV